MKHIDCHGELSSHGIGRSRDARRTGDALARQVIAHSVILYAFADAKPGSSCRGRTCFANRGRPHPRTEDGADEVPPKHDAQTGAFIRVLRTKTRRDEVRSEEHTSELQSLMRLSYAGFCLKKKRK